MIHLTDSATQWALALLLCVLTGTFLLIVLAMFRRWQHIRHMRYRHSLRSHYRSILAEALSGTASAYRTHLLRQLPLPALELLFDPLFSRRRVPEGRLAPLQALCAQLGLIKLWQQRLAEGEEMRNRPESPPGASARIPRLSPQLLQRAKAIRNLGVLRHEPSWPLLVRTLDDPHPDIQSVTLRALGAIHALASFPALLRRLHTVILEKGATPSLQALQAALVCFDLTSSAALFASLRHPHRQIRLIATDILRVMAGRNASREPDLLLGPEAISGEITALLVTNLWRDPSAGVRGHAAEVIAFLRDPRATTVLYELLFDPQWPVRLRTVQALAGSHHATDLLLLGICDRLCDSHAQVREAAIQTLISLGGRGRQQLFEHFLTSSDPLTRQQIVEAVERTGLLAPLIEDYGQGTGGLEALMVEQLAGVAAPLGLSGALRMLNPPARQRFHERFLRYGHFTIQLREETRWQGGSQTDPQQILDFPPILAT
jgi:HEAT repeat protein